METIRKLQSRRSNKSIPIRMYELQELVIPVTDEMIINDFINRHPTLAKQIVTWSHCGHRRIRVWLNTGMILEHSFINHVATIIKDGFNE